MIPFGPAAGLLALILLTPLVASADTVVVGSKNFPESRLLAEMFAQVIEHRT